MLSRRQAVAGMAAALGLPRLSLAAVAPEIGQTFDAAGRPKLAVTEQLMYATVRIADSTTAPSRWGTGFLFSLFHTNQSFVPVVVTNQHVLRGLSYCAFKLATSLPDGAPDLENHATIEITNLPSLTLDHPSADLAAILVGPAIQSAAAQARKPFWVYLSSDLIPTADELKLLLPVEQVLTVGFPGAIWDDAHNLPVFHRGYTATAPYIDFKGNQEFLIDITTWPGASGSPVLLFNDNGWTDRSGNTVVGGTRTKLIGVVYGVAIQDVGGDVAIQAGPTQITGTSRMAIPTNLGACIRASRILEFEPQLARLGVKPPAGYVMRAK